jgi:hypothetical protein
MLRRVFLASAGGASVRALIEIGGHGPRHAGAGVVNIIDEFLPAGSRGFQVTDAGSFRPGQHVIVRRAGNGDWIHETGIDPIKPRPANEPSTHHWKPFDPDFK